MRDQRTVMSPNTYGTILPNDQYITWAISTFVLMLIAGMFSYSNSKRGALAVVVVAVIMMIFKLLPWSLMTVAMLADYICCHEFIRIEGSIMRAWTIVIFILAIHAVLAMVNVANITDIGLNISLDTSGGSLVTIPGSTNITTPSSVYFNESYNRNGTGEDVSNSSSFMTRYWWRICR